jgi:hypothetical protein
VLENGFIIFQHPSSLGGEKIGHGINNPTTPRVITGGFL